VPAQADELDKLENFSEIHLKRSKRDRELAKADGIEKKEARSFFRRTGP